MTAPADHPFAAPARAWFETLRDRLCAAFEAIEDEAGADAGPHAALPPGRFERAAWTRPTEAEEGGGGVMSLLRNGRVFEKVGVNWSEVHGTLAPRAQTAMAARGVPGIGTDPRFWASGISLVAHLQNPHAPAVHMNTRMFWTPGAWWFGGGTDLNPALEYPEDTAHFHDTLRAACAPHVPNWQCPPTLGIRDGPASSAGRARTCRARLHLSFREDHDA